MFWNAPTSKVGGVSDEKRIFSKAGLLRKASAPIVVTPLPIVTLVRLLPANALSPMVVTLSGIVMLVRLPSLNEKLPIVVTPCSMITFVMESR
jgi:hypothetical protein